MSRIIEVSHLTKKYEKSIGIEDISFSVKKGEVFAILGGEASGKTTLVRAMLGLISYQGGIQIFGKDATKEKIDILRDIGYMPSKGMNYPDMTVQEVLQLFADLRKKDCWDVAKELCDRLELDIDKTIQELSLEENKKLGLVCAMQHQPKLLILDEPAKNIDSAVQELFFRLIREAKGWGTTCLITTNQMTEVLQNCTRAAILQEGRIIKIDSVENLVKNKLRKVRVWKDNEEKNFPYSGSMHELITLLAEIKVDDVLIEEPSLEEIIAQYEEIGE